MKFINKLIIIAISSCSAMQTSEIILYDILTQTPQPAKERICHYLRPNEGEMGLITSYFEKYKNKASAIPENVYKAFDVLEYHHKILMSRLILSQMSPRINSQSNGHVYNEVKFRLKSEIRATPSVNVHVSVDTISEKSLLLHLMHLPETHSYLEKSKEADSMNGFSFSIESWEYEEKVHLMKLLEKDLGQAGHFQLSAYRGILYEKDSPEEDRLIHSFVVTVPFRIFFTQACKYFLKLETHIENIFQEELKESLKK